MKLKNLLKTVAALGVVGALTSTPVKAAGTIVDTAVQAGQFSTLVQAVKAAGLADTLSGSGPFTVFAPTDAAFAKLPPGALEALLADKEALTQVLTYHVLPGTITADQVVRLSSAKTVQGEHLSIGTKPGVTVDGATVVKTDIATSNGVIHVIDTVMLPLQVKGATSDDLMDPDIVHVPMEKLSPQAYNYLYGN